MLLRMQLLLMPSSSRQLQLMCSKRLRMACLQLPTAGLQQPAATTAAIAASQAAIQQILLLDGLPRWPQPGELTGIMEGPVILSRLGSQQLCDGMAAPDS